MRKCQPALVAIILCAAVPLLSGCAAGKPDTPVAGGQSPRGRTLISSYGCGSCHQVPGVRSATGSVGPSLKGIARRAYLAGRLPNTPRNMVHWIRHPHEVDPQTVMPEMNATEQDARDLTEFLYTLH